MSQSEGQRNKSYKLTPAKLRFCLLFVGRCGRPRNDCRHSTKLLPRLGSQGVVENQLGEIWCILGKRLAHRIAHVFFSKCSWISLCQALGSPLKNKNKQKQASIRQISCRQSVVIGISLFHCGLVSKDTPRFLKSKIGNTGFVQIVNIVFLVSARRNPMTLPKITRPCSSRRPLARVIA